MLNERIGLKSTVEPEALVRQGDYSLKWKNPPLEITEDFRFSGPYLEVAVLHVLGGTVDKGGSALAKRSLFVSPSDGEITRTNLGTCIRYFNP